MYVVATAGHVDHGKSTLLRALTGMEPDRWDEERRRGLTIDLGFVWTDLDGLDEPLAFVDVPGHERFVPNMLAGAGAVALCLFVVAADDGWSAQSEEHLAILDLLGVRGALVAVTKREVAGEDRTSEVAAQVARRLGGTSLAGAPIVSVDSVSGTGIDDLRALLVERLRAADRAGDRRRPRLWIDRAFTIGGAGTVVTGTLSGGRLQVGEDVALLPARRVARIRGLHALGASVDVATPGARVAVNLAGVDVDEVERGDALVGASAGDPRDAWLVTDTVDTWVRVLPRQELDRAGAWHLHVGSAETTCTVHPLLGEPVREHASGAVRLVLGRPLPLRSGDRFVLREAGRRATVAGGEVLDPRPPGRVRGPDARLARVVALEAIRDAPVGTARLAPLTDASGGARPRTATFAAADLPLDAPLAEGLHRVDDWLLTSAAHDRWTRTAERSCREHHAAHPSSPGPDRVVLATALVDEGVPTALAELLPDDLVAAGVLRRHGSSYALPDHAPAQTERRRAGVDELLARLDAEPFAPPDLKATAAELGVTFPELQQLEQSRRIARAGAVAFTSGAVERAVTELRELEAEVGPFTASQARERLGTSRKYAIPLLELLDARGVTRFDGQHRTTA